MTFMEIAKTVKLRCASVDLINPCYRGRSEGNLGALRENVAVTKLDLLHYLSLWGHCSHTSIPLCIYDIGKYMVLESAVKQKDVRR